MNQIDGYGEFYWRNGDFYRGNWKENQITGYGVMSYKDGRIYEGEFQ